jgi:hypothetical protein
LHVVFHDAASTKSAQDQKFPSIPAAIAGVILYGNMETILGAPV